MGSWISKLVRQLEKICSPHSKIAMVGLDGAGKTTILYKHLLKETITTSPTIGFNYEKERVKNMKFAIWDLGGHTKVRDFWKYHFDNLDGLIFVVDSSDRERLKEAAEVLHDVLNDRCMRGIPVEIFANKQDLPGAATTTEVAAQLRLRELVHNKWYVQATCGVTGEGLVEGFETLAKLVHGCATIRMEGERKWKPP